eukprot:6859986-Pyramimonas_sp.AAC.1
MSTMLLDSVAANIQQCHSGNRDVSTGQEGCPHGELFMVSGTYDDLRKDLQPILSHLRLVPEAGVPPLHPKGDQISRGGDAPKDEAEKKTVGPPNGLGLGFIVWAAANWPQCPASRDWPTSQGWVEADGPPPVSIHLFFGGEESENEPPPLTTKCAWAAQHLLTKAKLKAERAERLLKKVIQGKNDGSNSTTANNSRRA